MPLLDPPKPEIPKRKYYARIDEPLAITMEKYAELLQAGGPGCEDVGALRDETPCLAHVC